MAVIPFDKALKLTIKQERFAFAYVESGNATAAYRQAYKALAMSAGATPPPKAGAPLVILPGRSSRNNEYRIPS